MKKITRILKAAGEFCSIGAGVATIFMSVIGAFVTLPLFVSFVVAAGIGLTCAVLGSYHEAKQIQKEEQQHEAAISKQDQAYQAIKKELDEIKTNLEAHHKNITVELGCEDQHPFLDQAKTSVNQVHAQVAHLCKRKNAASPKKEHFYLFSPKTVAVRQAHQPEKPLALHTRNKSPRPAIRSINAPRNENRDEKNDLLIHRHY
jgi:phosphate/sulfate permease